MKNAIMVTILLAFSLLFLFCGCGEKNPFREPPLKEEISFSYHETSEHKERGRTMQETIDIRFEKRDAGMFDSIKTYTDKYGPREQDPLEVDGFFKYNKIMDLLVSHYVFWRDPKVLASGNIGTAKVEKGTYNGKTVYIHHSADYEKEYYTWKVFLRAVTPRQTRQR